MKYTFLFQKLRKMLVIFIFSTIGGICFICLLLANHLLHIRSESLMNNRFVIMEKR